MLDFICTGTLPVEVDMNRIPKLDSAEAQDEIPPPLPERSANMFSDSPSHTFNSGSQGQEPTATTSLLPPSVSNETSAPALPPKPANMKLVGIKLIIEPVVVMYYYVTIGRLVLQ